MEELTIIGEKNRRIFAAFLKEKGIYDEFVINTREFKKGRYCSSNNNLFNTQSLEYLFKSFFSFACVPYPSNLNFIERFEYWTDLYQKWKEFCYYQKYKYEYNIW